MSSLYLGLGIAPLGTSKLGFGSPASSDAPGTAPIGTGRYIDPLKRDYVMDATGNLTRGQTVPQLVYLALVTVKGSSVLGDLGLAPLPDKFTPTFVADFDAAVRSALASLIARKLVELISVTMNRTGSRVRPLIRWRDLTTTAEHVDPI